MFESKRPLRHSIRFRARRGQTLIVVLAVLFVLLFIGGLFVAQIARNLTAAGRSRDTQTADALADAGINYCDRQLTFSEDGADWRPIPSAPITNGTDTKGVTDPDAYWLQLGFTRVAFNGGRALVRVTYDPHPDDPRSQLLRIESVGRPGDVGNGSDPTVFVQNGVAPRLRSEKVAYKRIGLTDYLRFITNKDKSERENFLGTPSFGRDVATVFGDPIIADKYPAGIDTTSNNIFYSGGIWANSNLKMGGNTYIYVSARGNKDALGKPNFALSPEGVFATGNITVSQITKDPVTGNPLTSNPLGLTDASHQVFINQKIEEKPAENTDPNLDDNIIRPTGDPLYSAKNGTVRDGSSDPDRFGYTRGLSYIDPPIIDGYVDSSGTLRYRALTRESGTWLNQSFNTGQAGWGRNVYVDNDGDRQIETARPGVGGGYSLRADWLDPRGGFGVNNWNGPHYEPPGVIVELHGDSIRLIRNDGKLFRDPLGNTITQQGGKVIDIPLADIDRSHFQVFNPNTGVYEEFPLPHLDYDGDDPTQTSKPYTDPHSYGVNLVILAEGNVRVRGVYGIHTDASKTQENYDPTDPSARVSKLARVHLTIVSGGTAYIDGNVLKGDDDKASTCAILAKDYVCINTTQFLRPQNQGSIWSPDGNAEDDGFKTEIGLTRPSYDTSFSFGIDPGNYNTGQFLFLRHSALSANGAYINMQVNPALEDGSGNSLFNFDGNTVYSLLGTDSVSPNFELRAFDLAGAGTLNSTPGYDNYFRFMLDQTGQNSLIHGTADYLLGNAMVAPLDIRVEALLYAQERSFFVIPGYNLNPNRNDTWQKWLSSNNNPNLRTRPSYSTPLDPKKVSKDMYPFYGEPTDVRITVFGAVAENYTASEGDQAAWMAKWGYIPAQFGSSDKFVPDIHLRAHDPNVPGDDASLDFRTPFEVNQAGNPAINEGRSITRGLRFVYDPALAMPYMNPTKADLAGSANSSLRQSRALRVLVRAELKNSNGDTILPEIRQTLPPVPKLPVCPGLLFTGNSEQVIGK